MLKETEKFGCRAATTPMDENSKNSIKDRQNPDGKAMGKYQRLESKFICLALIRLDIAHVMNMVNQFMHAPTEVHMQAAERIVCYLKWKRFSLY